MSLADRVKQKRIELGLTQAEAAEMAGIRQQSWQSIEDGKTLKPRNIIGIAKALKYVQAGALAEKNPIEAFDGNLEYILTDSDISEYTFALRIEGDSMEPDFKAGDIIIVDPEVEPTPGEFVVARNGGAQATFKKYRPTYIDPMGCQHFELVPLNDDYPVINSDHQPLTIIGVMIEHRIYRRKR